MIFNLFGAHILQNFKVMESESDEQLLKFLKDIEMESVKKFHEG